MYIPLNKYFCSKTRNIDYFYSGLANCTSLLTEDQFIAVCNKSEEEACPGWESNSRLSDYSRQGADYETDALLIALLRPTYPSVLSVLYPKLIRLQNILLRTVDCVYPALRKIYTFNINFKYFTKNYIPIENHTL